MKPARSNHPKPVGDDNIAEAGAQGDQHSSARKSLKPSALVIDGFMVSISLFLGYESSSLPWFMPGLALVLYALILACYAGWRKSHSPQLWPDGLSWAAMDTVGLLGFFAFPIVLNWLTPTTLGLLFSLLLLLLSSWVVVTLRLGVNPLAEDMGTQKSVSFVGILGIIAILCALLPPAIDKRDQSEPHKLPEFPDQIIGFARTHNPAAELPLEPLWLPLGAGAVYGDRNSALEFSVTAWKSPHLDDGAALAVTFLAGKSISIGSWSCVSNWNGRVGGELLKEVKLAAQNPSRLSPQDQRKWALFVFDYGLAPAEGFYQDASSQSKYFWKGVRTNDVILPRENLACGEWGTGKFFAEGLNFIVIFYHDGAAQIPQSRLAIDRVMDQLSTYYGSRSAAGN